jgi:hypothetical protein
MGGEEGADKRAVDMNRVLRKTSIPAQEIFIATQEVCGN